MIKCSELFTDNMILQRDKAVCVWGKSDLANDVHISIDNITITVNVLDGSWKGYIPAHEAGGPYTLEIRQGEQIITFNQVMYGEVFLASGQSNMEMILRDSQNGETEALLCNYMDIRYFNVLKTGYVDEDVEEKMRESCWTSCLNGESGNMSAVAYYAAKRLYETLNVPIGIIDCYQGGTSIASWLPEDVLQEYQLGRERIEEYAALVGDKTDEEYEREVEEYWRQWHKWDDMVKMVKKNNPYATYEEITEVAGECPWPQPAGNKSVFRPTGCYESMIRRVTPYTVKGILYYQGESDDDKALKYLPVMKALIADWRKHFEDGELYFVITQLPMYIEKGVDDTANWAVIRDYQLKISEDISKVGFLTLADCGEFGNIHPVDKKTPGTRLGELILEELFSCETKAKAMLPGSIYKKDDEIIIECQNAYGEICINSIDNNAYPMNFEVSSGDGEYYACEYKIQGEQIVIYGDAVSAATKIRYGWKNYGKVEIFNKAGIPLAPFGDRDIA